MIYILILSISVLLLVSYILSRNDYMAPTFLMTAMFWLSGICVWINCKIWNADIMPFTVFIIINGIIFFYIGYYIIDYMFVRKFNKVKENKLHYISVSNWKVIIYIIFSIIILILNVKAIINAVGNYGTWSEIMERYRYATVYQEITNKQIYIPSFLSTGKMVINATGYIFVYVFINNFLITRKWEKIKLCAILTCLIVSLVGAQRLDLIRIPLAMMVTYYALNYSTGKFTYRNRTKLLLKYIGLTFVIILCFSGVRTLVGRQNTSGTVEYISQYLGGPIVLLDDYLKEPLHNSNIFGKESFWGIYNFIYSITGNIKYKYDFTLEFRTINGIDMGNVYSAFRMYYEDFGFWGIVIMDFILGVIFSMLYVFIRYNIKVKFSKKYFLKYKSKVNFLLIIYSVIVHSIVMMFYQDWFFSHVIEWYQIKLLIIMWLIKVVLVDLDKNNKLIL